MALDPKDPGLLLFEEDFFRGSQAGKVSDC